MFGEPHSMEKYGYIAITIQRPHKHLDLAIEAAALSAAETTLQPS
jgi:hypothetical protein